MAAQITQAEINELKAQFDKKVGKFSVTFDKDENGEENFKIYNGKSGADAYWSGKIILQNDYSISWKFSLLDGATLSTESFKIDDNTKDIVLYIKDMYDIWYQSISPYIGEEMSNPTSPSQANVEVPTEEQLPIAESINLNNRQKVINENNDRMKRLAGL